jgi:hypothetical protein
VNVASSHFRCEMPGKADDLPVEPVED